MPHRPSILDGISVADLQQRLTAMQNALMDLTSGMKVATASYSQADGARTVSYTQADVGTLTAAITNLQTQIGRLTGAACVNRRAPMRPIF